VEKKKTVRLFHFAAIQVVNRRISMFQDFVCRACFFRGLLPAVALAVLFAPHSCASQFDAFSDFSASNPNGSWSYGTGVTGSTFTPLTVYDGSYCNSIVSSIACWTIPNPVDKTPFVAINTDASVMDVGTGILPAGELLVHPAQSADTIVEWTAPSDGTYTLAGFFQLLDAKPSGIIGEVYDNATQVYSGALTGPGANYDGTAGAGENFDLTLNLAAGDVVSFGVNNGGSFYDDATGFDAAISAADPADTAPEPASLALLGAGLACLGMFRRRRSK
jgi:hypothetical protein